MATPTYVQAYLFNSGGIYYHSLFCCDCNNPHWSTAGYRSVQSTQPCPASGGACVAVVAIGQAVQIPVGGLPMSSPYYQVELERGAAVSGGPGITIGRLPPGWVLAVAHFGDPVALQNNQTAAIPQIHEKSFAVNFFTVTFPDPCQKGGVDADGTLALTFGLAEPSTIAGEANVLTFVDDSLSSSGVVTEPQRLFGAVANYNNTPVPVMIVAEP
jgi:hypothetical protein